MDEALKYFGKAVIQLGNYLLVFFLFVPAFAENRETSLSDFGIGLTVFISLYTLGYFLISKGVKIEENKNNKNKGN